MGKLANFFRAQRISLAVQQTQQMLALDKELDTSESKVKILEAENLKLRAEVNPLKREVERLKNQIEKSAVHGYELDDVEVNILQTLSSGVGSEIASNIATDLAISQTRAEYYLSKLEDAEFIRATLPFYEPTKYSLSQRGREYLVKHGLV